MTPPPLPRSPPKAQSRCGGRGTEAVYRYIDTGGAVAYVLVSRLWLLRDLAFRIRDHVQYSIKPCSIELNSFGTPTSPSSLAPRAPPTPRPVRAPNLTSVTIVVVTNRLATRTTHASMLARLAGAGAGRLTPAAAPPLGAAPPPAGGGVGAPSPSTPPSSPPLPSSPPHAASRFLSLPLFVSLSPFSPPCW